MIYYRGLNCHLASIINIAASVGINYRDAFYNLWSETDFNYNLEYQMFLSKRVLPNLEALGAKIENLNDASQKEEQDRLSLIPDGELFLVGMDTFHIPWSIKYQYFYEPHYFYAQKESADELLCFDPVHGQENVQIKYSNVLNHAFDLCRVYKVAEKAPQAGLKQEADQILQKHPKTQKEWQAKILTCKNAGRKHIYPIIKQISAMINNRYLFEQFLHQPSSVYEFNQQFFDKDFFSRWGAVKNGLFKSTIVKNNKDVVDEVCDLFLNLLDEEIAIAEQIIKGT